MNTLFVDENKSRPYTMVAVTVPGSALSAIRKEVAQLRKTGQRRVHFVKESASRRRLIVSRFSRLDLHAHVYRVAHLREAPARQLCLEAIVGDAAESGLARIVVERDDSIENLDKRILFNELRRLNARESIEYEHDVAAREPMLWVPDAVAWCVARGGEWEARVRPLVRVTRKLGT